MIVYVNGDSYAKVSNGKRYGEFLSENFNCPVLNSAISGSSNGRIIRTSLRDLLDLKQTHNNIIAVISLTFPLRTELWDPNIIDNYFANDGEFVSLQTTQSKRWFYDNESVEPSRYQSYIKEWLRWYNIEAETVELLKEILLLPYFHRLSKPSHRILRYLLQLFH